MRERITRWFAHLHPHLFTAHRRETRRYFAHHDMPYPVDCAVLGHRPVWIDLASIGSGYFECSRCTLRPAVTDEARRWTRPDPRTEPRAFLERALNEGAVYWPTRRAESHLEVSRGFVDRFAFEVSLGTAGSETPLDAHLIIPGWRGFYAGTSVLGNRLAHWRSRRARDPETRWESRVVGLSIDGDSVRWQLGAFKSVWRKSDPRWLSGSWSWRDALQGKTVHTKEDGEPAEVVIPMPEGGYPAVATPYRQTWRRPRFQRRPRVHVGVEFRVDGGIPNGREKYGDWDSTWGFAVEAPRGSVDGFETWAPLEAAARMLRDRQRYARADWIPPADARNPRMIPR